MQQPDLEINAIGIFLRGGEGIFQTGYPRDESLLCLFIQRNKFPAPGHTQALLDCLYIPTCSSILGIHLPANQGEHRVQDASRSIQVEIRIQNEEDIQIGQQIRIPELSQKLLISVKEGNFLLGEYCFIIMCRFGIMHAFVILCAYQKRGLPKEMGRRRQSEDCSCTQYKCLPADHFASR